MIAQASESIDRIHALLTLYRESHYDVTLSPLEIATIRIGAATPPGVLRWMADDDVAVYMTACNPRSHSLTPEENRQRLDALRGTLDRRGARYLEGAGHIPGESWREESLLVRGLSAGDVAALVREHDQNSVVIVRSTAPAVLRIYRPDWHAAAGDRAGIEWDAR